MEGNKILCATSRLHEVNDLLKKFVNGQPLSFEEYRSVWLFYRDFNDTNSLIDYAEDAAHCNLDYLLLDTDRLLAEAVTCTNIFDKSEDTLSLFDSKPAFEWFIKPYKEAYERESGKANVLWHKFTSLSNHLDHMFYGGCSQEEIDQVQKECDETQVEYHKQQDYYKGLYKKYREEEQKLLGLRYFDITLLNILATKLVSICHSIIRDITRIKKEGGS